MNKVPNAFRTTVSSNNTKKNKHQHKRTTEDPKRKQNMNIFKVETINSLNSPKGRM